MKKILVGIDFDKYTEKLIKTAVDVADSKDSKIWLLHVVAPNPDFVGYKVGPQYIRDFRAKELKKEHRELMKYVELIKEKKLQADGLLIKGNTAKTIFDESKKLGIDIIVSGYHERSLLHQVIFGSNFFEIIKSSEIPVLIVPCK